MKQRKEQFKVEFSDLRRNQDYALVGGRDFRIDFQSIMEELRLPLSSRIRDLLRIAATVYSIDRLVTRDRKHGPENWPRHIRCGVETRNSGFWSGNDVSDLLHAALQFVSGDQWDLSFVQDESRPVVTNDLLFKSSQLFDTPPVIGLYSGGLDSAAGLARQLATRSGYSVLPVTVRHRNDISDRTANQLEQISSHFGRKLYPIAGVASSTTPKSLVCREEVSQRSRSFLFVSVAGAIAGATESNEIELYESGIGAVNVPLLAGMEGSQATRSAHPHFLELMSRLLTLVLDREVRVELPFRQSTKGDVVASLRGSPLSKLAGATVSCAHFPVRTRKGEGWKSCGLCPACIFRRVALHAAGVSEPVERYAHDILNADSKVIPPKKMRYLLAYLLQVDSLRVLDEGRLPPLLEQHLRNTEIDRAQCNYAEVYGTYRSEWYEFIKHARCNGCDWAFRVELPAQAA